MLDVAVIGGGLAGLSLALQLQAMGCRYAVFEAGNRFGGRILSRPPPGDSADDVGGFRADLGPSWIWPNDQPRLAEFIDAYRLAVYPQWLCGRSLYHNNRLAAPQPFVDHATYASARRLAGGSYRLIEALTARLPADRLHLNRCLLAVSDRGDHVALQFRQPSSAGEVRAKRVVLAMPPRLLAERMVFDPPLAPRLKQAMADTPTWMAGHAKAVICYRRAFWRDAGWSGSALSDYQGAVLGEVFDVCSADGKRAALSGFFALPASLRGRYRDDLEAMALAQLVGLFGAEAARPEAVLIQDWSDEPFTATAADASSQPVHPQYGHRWLQLDHWNDKLYFCGTETSAEHGGYLEGALASAQRVARTISPI